MLHFHSSFFICQDTPQTYHAMRSGVNSPQISKGYSRLTAIKLLLLIRYQTSSLATQGPVHFSPLHYRTLCLLLTMCMSSIATREIVAPVTRHASKIIHKRRPQSFTFNGWNEGNLENLGFGTSDVTLPGLQMNPSRSTSFHETC